MPKKAIPKQVNTQIKKYIDILKKDKLPIKKVILFGSFAKGTQRKWSDIDLCIISPKFQDSWKADEYLWNKRKIFDVNYTIEPVGFTPQDMRNKYDTLIHEINKHGIEIPL